MSANAEPAYIDGIKCYAAALAREGGDYPAEAFDKLVELESKSFWFRSRNRIIKRVFRKFVNKTRGAKVLEIGCGTGYVLRGLRSENRYKLVGAEQHIDGLRHARKRLPDVEFVQLDARNLPFKNEFDAIGAFDVIEHIEEDVEVIRSARAALAENGALIVTVPQHAWLWSSADEHARHKRRYSRSELTSKLEQEGFTVEFCSSFVFLLLPLMYLSRKGQRTGADGGNAGHDHVYEELSLPRPLNAFMEMMMAIDELLIAAGVSLPIGGSLLVVARRGKSVDRTNEAAQ